MTLQRFLADHQPAMVACCFDAGAQTFRNELFPDYKANRGAPPEELVPQFDLCRELVERMGFATVMTPGFEADDLIATLTVQLLRGRARGGHRHRRQGSGPVPGTGRQDLQPGQGRMVGRGGCPRPTGRPGRQVVDLLALTGDAVDNIPGVRGVGPKAATALLAEFADLDAIYADLDRVETPARPRGQGPARASWKRTVTGAAQPTSGRPRPAAPCGLSPEDLHYTGAAGQRIAGFCRTLGAWAGSRN